MFATAMAGSAQTHLLALLNDFPWDKLGKATVVDVGEGIACPCCKKYGDLSVVIQDRESVADFFQPNNIHGAEVYMLRYTMDDWNDDACATILSAIKALLISAWLPAGSATTLAVAPEPLLPNYGAPQRFIHCRDLNMMNLINGTERTVSEMTLGVINRAGLVVQKIWECRGAASQSENGIYFPQRQIFLAWAVLLDRKWSPLVVRIRSRSEHRGIRRVPRVLSTLVSLSA
ncbi:hypothetical protein B0H14DRAFT_2957268 [Mycena olivaceomarginata]|nr:hypothetical protein B0H14DRAFT_2957268 [Mycena olivaceomarginata]